MADEDRDYTAWLRKLPCCAPRCREPIAGHAHHRTGAGVAIRAHDHKAIPLCPVSHHNFHAGAGEFEGWTKEERAAWQDKMIALYRTAYVTPRGPGDVWIPRPTVEKPSKILPRRGV
jgi:hypothetical protein